MVELAWLRDALARGPRLVWVVAAVAIYLPFRLGSSIFQGEPAELDITGKWRPSEMPGCTDLYLSIATNGIELKNGAGPADRLPVEVEIVGAPNEQKILLLRLHGETRPIKIAMATELQDDELRFVSADWSTEAHAKYEEALNKPPLVGVPSRFLDLMGRVQPFRRCSS